jgi:hypothetical protein
VAQSGIVELFTTPSIKDISEFLLKKATLVKQVFLKQAR